MRNGSLSIATAVLLCTIAMPASGQFADSPACPERVVSVAGDSSPGRSPGGAVADTVSRDTTSAVDIAILASASVREVRFARQPVIRVRLCGGLDSVKVVERRNLPDRIVAGQPYRDVYIAVEILGRVDAACLARTLGVPAPAEDSATGVRADAGSACAAITVGGVAPESPPEGSGAMPTTAPSGTEGAPRQGRIAPARP